MNLPLSLLMPFTGHTPEALLGRSDSKNPATTCKGLTNAGKPCRRSIASLKKQASGVLAVVQVDSKNANDGGGAAAFYCWQHRDQAELLVESTSSSNTQNGDGRQHRTELYPLQERTSIDTLIDRLGVIELEDEATPTPSKPPRKDRQTSSQPSRATGSIKRPPTWGTVHGPLMAVPSGAMSHSLQRSSAQRPARRRQPSFWSSLCCVGTAEEDDYVEVVRHKKRMKDMRRPEMQQQTRPAAQRPSQAHEHVASYSDLSQKPQPGSANAQRPSRSRRESETQRLMSLIPRQTPPATASLLLAELSKPISPHDEGGYIYIFWLTSDAQQPPPTQAAASLLSPPASRSAHDRRLSDVLSDYSSTCDEPTGKKTVLLKIGRASNVHRRMNEWTRQCGHNITLLRYYPYTSSSAPASPAGTPTQSPNRTSLSSQGLSGGGGDPVSPGRPHLSPRQSSVVRKVPHAHRVERLIHIELNDKRVKRSCSACGKEHREWFEVEASVSGVKIVDEVVKRWVRWAEDRG